VRPLLKLNLVTLQFYSKVSNPQILHACNVCLKDHVVHVMSFDHASNAWTRINHAVARNKKLLISVTRNHAC